MMTHDPRRSNALSCCDNTRFWPVLRRKALILAFLPLLGCAMSPPETENADSPGAGMVSLGQQLQARGDNIGATDFYLRALQKDPDNYVARRGLAQAYEKTGRLKEAADEYRAVSKIRTKDTDSLRNLGRLMLAQEKASEARDAFQAALDRDSGDIKAMNGLGAALNYLGDHEGAQKIFKKALKEDPNNLSTLNNLAYSYILDNQFKEAIQLLEPQQKNPAATSALRQNLALAYGLAGMDLDAERVAKMDLPAEQVQKNMDYYKRRRAELAVSTAPYAEIGTYATQALAEAEIDKLQDQFEKSGMDLKPVIRPQVAAPGGTPRFAVQMMGCSKASDVQVFCDQLAKSGVPCLVRNGK